MGLLVEAGLYVGEVIPPAADNPRGFFENRNLVDINKRILGERGRDWTCPPASLDPKTLDLSALRWVGEELSWQGQPWGLKDPRLLFTLPAWAAALGPCMLVGVHRNSEAVARSMAARSDLTLDQAKSIAHAYAERLAEAHKRLGFPIISFDSAPEEFVERARSVAGLVGLGWEPTSDRSAFDSQLVHHRSPREPLPPADEYLERAARGDFETIPSYTPTTVIKAWRDLPSGHARDLPLHLGPEYSATRDSMIRASVERLPDVSAIVVVEPEQREFEAGGMSHVSMTPTDFLARISETEERWSHVIAPGLFDVVPPADLELILDKVRSHLEAKAVVAISGWFLDGEDLPASHVFNPSDVTASRRTEPYLHHLDELAAAILGRDLYLVDITRMDDGRSHILLTSDRSIPRTVLGTSHLRSKYLDLETKAASLESQLALHVAAEATARRRAVEAEAKSDELRAQLKETRKRFNGLRSRVAVRWALRIADLVGPMLRRLRRIRPRRGTSDAVPRRFSLFRQARLSRGISMQRPGSSRTSGPLVSMVILTRDAADHLERLLTSLEKTTYRSFEVIVVDNGSADDTAQVLKSHPSLSLTVIENEANVSFSHGNNQGAAIASGELLLLLNNDVEAVNAGWLGALVDVLDRDSDVAAVGAELVYPERGDPRTDLKVQHFGIRFGVRDGAIRPLNVRGQDPLDKSTEGVVEVPAVTAAALLTRTRTFHDVGGFDEGYVYGAEDVDLCLRLADHGRLAVTGQSVLYHHESLTQHRHPSEAVKRSRQANWSRFAGTWGPRLTRSVLRERLSGGSRYIAASPPTVAITLTHDDISKGWGDYYTAHELGEAFVEYGWEVIYAERYNDGWYQLDDGVDLIISLLDSYDVRRAPAGAFTIAWIRNWVDRWVDQPWLDAFDLVATSSHKAAMRVAQQTRFSPAVIPLATNPERFEAGKPDATHESDYVFTGNNWGPGRRLIELIDVHQGERFRIYGKAWDEDPRAAPFWHGSIDYDHLASVYASTKIVLDDTATPTLPYAFLNGRVFDALAAGALVISDNVEGSEEMFDGDLPTYTDRHELRSKLDHFLANEGDRLELVEKLRDRITTKHSYSSRPREFVDAAIKHIERPHAAIKIAVPSEKDKPAWGDTHFADGLAAALTSAGMPTVVHILPEWDLPANQAVDVAIHIRGLSSYLPKPAHVNVMWIISHPNDISVRECEKYDLVLVASRSYAAWLESQIEIPVVYMPQATDHRRFRPVEPKADLSTDVLFLGNSRGQKRPAVSWAIERGLPLVVFGGGWEKRIPLHHLRADHFPNEDLATLYASAKVVLNDHWPDMRERGFVSNRVFDALASGAVVVSDAAGGLDELFGDLVPTYGGAEELDSVVRSLLQDEGRRESISRAGRNLVLAEHTFARRAAQLIELLDPLLDDRCPDLECSKRGFDVAIPGSAADAP